MKILDLKRKLVVNFVASGFLTLLFSSIIYYNLETKKDEELRITTIATDAENIKNNIALFQNKSEEAKKYKKIWSEMGSNKKNTSGIKMDDVNANISKIAAKYYVSNQTTKVLLPEVVTGGVFDRPSIITSVTTVTLEFICMTDVQALQFIEEVMNMLPGYKVVTDISFSKTRAYNDQDIANIGSGKDPGLLSAKISFLWYTCKDKQPAQKPALDKTVPSKEASGKTP